MSGRYASSSFTRELIQEADCFPKDADFYDIIEVNKTGIWYLESFNILKLHCYLCIALGVIALLFNSLLLYIVLTHSKRLESVRNLFVVTCVIDLVLAAINIISVPYVHPTMGYYIGLANIPYPVPNAIFINVLANVCGSLTSSSWVCLTLQFIYRLHMIKNGRQMRGREFQSFIAAALIALIIMNIAAFEIYGLPPDPRWLKNAQKILKGTGMIVDDRQIVGGKMGDQKVVVYVLLMSLIAFVGYGAVIYTEIARRLWLQKSASIEKTRKRISKANNAFLALALGPFVTELLPTAFLNMIARTCEPIHYSGVIANLVIVCGPIVNAISAMALVKPYRNAVLRYFTSKTIMDNTSTISVSRPVDISYRASIAAKGSHF